MELILKTHKASFSHWEHDLLEGACSNAKRFCDWWFQAGVLLRGTVAFFGISANGKFHEIARFLFFFICIEPRTSRSFFMSMRVGV